MQRRKLGSGLCEDLGGEMGVGAGVGASPGGGGCLHRAESLRCAAETNRHSTVKQLIFQFKK